MKNKLTKLTDEKTDIKCTVKDCEKIIYDEEYNRYGYCRYHYNRWMYRQENLHYTLLFAAGLAGFMLIVAVIVLIIGLPV